MRRMFYSVVNFPRKKALFGNFLTLSSMAWSIGMFFLFPLCVWEKKRYVLSFSNADSGTSLIPRIISASEISSLTIAPAYNYTNISRLNSSLWQQTLWNDSFVKIRFVLGWIKTLDPVSLINFSTISGVKADRRSHRLLSSRLIPMLWTYLWFRRIIPLVVSSLLVISWKK